MIRSYTIKRTEKLLREVKCYRASAEYYSSLLDCGALADGQRRQIEMRLAHVERTVAAVNRALGLLDPMDETIIRLMYIEGRDANAACDACALERSSVYRHRAAAVMRVAAAIYGG